MQKAVEAHERRRPPNRAGARAFWQSRATAIALLVLVPYAMVMLVRIAGKDAASVHHALTQLWVALPLLALILVGVWHMWLGMREILEDYVRKPGLAAVLFLNTLFSLAVALAAGGAVLKLWLWS